MFEEMRDSVTIKSTSGEGFAVEDAAVAFLAAHLLSGVSWRGAGEGLIKAIQCQMRQDGWFFDDVVLTLSDSDKESKCGCSIKSCSVFGAHGAPREFAISLWEQWLSNSGSGFQQGDDNLTLFAAQHTPEIREAWFGLCDSARVIAPDVFAERLVNGTEPSPLRRAAFKSLELSDIAAAQDPFQVARLLRKFRLAEHDFQHAESQSANQAILLCQQALEDAARNRAVGLWEALIAYCGRIRRKGGEITLPSLLAELAHRFPLKQHPRYAADWSKILDESRQRLRVLPTKIGGSVPVPKEVAPNGREKGSREFSGRLIRCVGERQKCVSSRLGCRANHRLGEGRRSRHCWRSPNALPSGAFNGGAVR